MLRRCSRQWSARNRQSLGSWAGFGVGDSGVKFDVGGGDSGGKFDFEEGDGGTKLVFRCGIFGVAFGAGGEVFEGEGEGAGEGGRGGVSVHGEHYFIGGLICHLHKSSSKALIAFIAIKNDKYGD